jgi:hypothetical protein
MAESNHINSQVYTKEERDKFAIEFGRWIIQNKEIENTSSWSEDTANYHLKKFKKEKDLCD